MRSRRFFTTALALTLALCAIGAPVAFGGPHGKGLTRPTIVHVSDRSGFDWADAGIGAAGGAALSMLGVGLVLLISERRGRLSSRSSGVTRSRSRPST
jgi:hypothetical protein